MNDSDHLLAAMPVPRAFFKLQPRRQRRSSSTFFTIWWTKCSSAHPGGRQTGAGGRRCTTPVILAISAFAALVSMGGAPKASILLGKGETEQAEKVVGSCTWMLLLLSVLLTGIMLAFGRPILLLFGASTDTHLLCGRLHEHLLPRHGLYPADTGAERLYYGAGQNSGQHGQRGHRRGGRTLCWTRL